MFNNSKLSKVQTLTIGAVPSEEGENAVQSEIQEFLEISEQRLWIFPRSALVGAGAGIAPLLFRAALTGADAVRNGLIAWSQSLPSLG